MQVEQVQLEVQSAEVDKQAELVVVPTDFDDLGLKPAWKAAVELFVPVPIDLFQGSLAQDLVALEVGH